MATARGALVVFEGLDRCGKSTQCARLVDFLKESGCNAHLMRFPERTTAIGSMIDAYLKSSCDLDDKAIHLLFAANRWELANTIKSRLLSGQTIVIDRYAYSGVAFSSAKGLDLSWCKQPDVGLPDPDLVIYLDITVEDAMKRGNFGEERYEKADFQRKVRDTFFKLRTEFDTPEKWKVLDATQSLEAIQLQIRELVRSTQEACAQSPIGRLWEGETSSSSGSSSTIN
eukprot:GILI01040416.1.p1 GENE.GILI01040416.1~~GILI01040416.1.p1  ORF type:complete len:228 (+),score=45.68 GILI01040416.1:63-746(+)